MPQQEQRVTAGFGRILGPGLEKAIAAHSQHGWALSDTGNEHDRCALEYRCLLATLYMRQQSTDIHGLDHMMVDAGFLRTVACFFFSVAGDRNDHSICAAFLSPQVLGNGIAVHSRQTDIEQHDLRQELAGHGDGIQPVVDNAHDMT
jgi:hypothetical protein